MKKGRSESSALIGVDRGYATFYEKALLVKPTRGGSLVVGRNGPPCPSRYASIRTSANLLLGGSVQDGIRLFELRAL